ncbi:hypothetical protein [Streptomyces sp. NPDC058252]|uniref:hypothetical protein n=1 Tax=Streptomyces sp. NPDC058252 TaxID=3346405 RepID=UPI0036E41853
MAAQEANDLGKTRPDESASLVRRDVPLPPPQPARPRKGWNVLRWLAGNQPAETQAEQALTESSDRYKLAYEAAVHALSQQDGTLGNLRNRATGLVTIATLIGSFTGFFGVGTKDNPLPLGYALGLITFIVLIVGLSVYVLLPKKDWTFGPDPQDILTSAEEDHGRLLWSQALGMQVAIKQNGEEIQKRANVYGWAVILLGLEAAFAVGVSLAAR